MITLAIGAKSTYIRFQSLVHTRQKKHLTHLYLLRNLMNRTTIKNPTTAGKKTTIVGGQGIAQVIHMRRLS
ncbi:MAG: hypothetical protein C4K48_05675 [Candidatus Thorarchaeota archaeon]|nr:MAG: hypothetical protein C4K48_05675 [Candidatus Thorarchaeota archaeon]